MLLYIIIINYMVVVVVVLVMFYYQICIFEFCKNKQSSRNQESQHWSIINKKTAIIFQKKNRMFIKIKE